MNLDAEQIAVLDAAAVLFDRFGYRKTTIDEIAQEAGIGKGSVYLRFKSKEEIGVAWLRRTLEGLFDDLVSDVEGRPPLEAVEIFLAQRIMRRFDRFFRHAQTIEEVLDALKSQVEQGKAAFHAREAELLSELLSAAVKQGSARSTDPLDDARTMILATNSLVPSSLRRRPVPDRPTVLLQAQSLAALLTRAVRK